MSAIQEAPRAVDVADALCIEAQVGARVRLKQSDDRLVCFGRNSDDQCNEDEPRAHADPLVVFRPDMSIQIAATFQKKGYFVIVYCSLLWSQIASMRC